MARARNALEDVPGAQAAIGQARRIEPSNLTYQLRELTLCPIVFDSVREIDDYRQELEARLDKLLDRGEAIPLETLMRAGFVPPYGLTYQGRCDREIKEKFAEVARRSLATRAGSRAWEGATRVAGAVRKQPAGEKMRIGIVVTFGHEGIALRSLAGVIPRLDPERFEVAVVCHHQSVEKMRAGIEQAGQFQPANYSQRASPSSSPSPLPSPAGRGEVEFVPIDTNFRRTCARIAKAQFDLLYYREIGSDALNYYLPFMGLAPRQCTGWGTPVTSGIAEVDYYLSWDLLEVPHAQEHYAERLWRMNNLSGGQVRVRAPPAARREEFGLPEGKHLYPCPQTLHKMHPDQDELFGEILRRDEKGLVVLIGGEGRTIGSPLTPRPSPAEGEGSKGRLKAGLRTAQAGLRTEPAALLEQVCFSR